VRPDGVGWPVTQPATGAADAAPNGDAPSCCCPLAAGRTRCGGRRRDGRRGFDLCVILSLERRNVGLGFPAMTGLAESSRRRDGHSRHRSSWCPATPPDGCAGYGFSTQAVDVAGGSSPGSLAQWRNPCEACSVLAICGGAVYSESSLPGCWQVAAWAGPALKAVGALKTAVDTRRRSQAGLRIRPQAQRLRPW
jgi:hypothetical protein